MYDGRHESDLSVFDTPCAIESINSVSSQRIERKKVAGESDPN